MRTSLKPPSLTCSTRRPTGKLGCLEKGVGYLLALVERSFEFLLMLTLLSFFLGVLPSFSVCWLEDEDEEELVLALESSSDIANPPPHPANGPCRGRKQNRNTDHAGAAKRELRCQEGAGRAAPAALQRLGAHRRSGRRDAGGRDRAGGGPGRAGSRCCRPRGLPASARVWRGRDEPSSESG